MQPRITSPALSLPGVADAFQALGAAAGKAGLPQATADLVHLRVSQISGCAVCPGMHARALEKTGEAGERLFTVAGWRDAPYFTDAERAALALAEAATRLADPVPGEIFDEARKHYDRAGAGCPGVQIAVINAWNRLNVTTGQVAGEWTAQWAG